MTDELDTSVSAAICSSVGFSFDVIPTDLEGPPTGPVENITEVFYPSGSLHIRVEGYRLPSGERIKHGTELIFHENGNLKKETPYYHNKKFGNCKSYFPDGKLESDYRYFNDKVGGQAYNYYPNGNMKSHAYWSDNTFHGPLIMYWPDGHVRIETNYHQGKRHGFERVFFESGKINYTGFWNNGFKDGHEIHYNEKGFTIMKLHWKMGILMARKKCYTKILTEDEVRAKALAASKKKK